MGSDDAASLSYPHAVGVVVGECGEGRGGDGGVVGGGTLTDGGEYLGDCVGGARTVCAALSPTHRGFTSCL